MKIIILLITLSLILAYTSNTYAQNLSITSFREAKEVLLNQVYFDNRETLYCGAKFDMKKQVNHPIGFTSKAFRKRSEKIEWEHLVPAENFGRTFSEWKDGHTKCLSNKGKLFKGRRCAEKINMEFRYMASDMYNLFPAIGSVNALRSNHNFAILDDNIRSNFGSCDIRIYNKKAQPPKEARGRIARAYLYMENTYSRYQMSSSQRKLMQAWHKAYPISLWECQRAARIKKIQNSIHFIYDKYCN